MPTERALPRKLERDTIPDVGRERAVRVRDVVRHIHHELAPQERMLRVPYDLFRPIGPVLLHDGLITYRRQSGELNTGRTAESHLSSAHPGERVLVRLSEGQSPSDQWWLCEIEKVILYQ